MSDTTARIDPALVAGNRRPLGATRRATSPGASPTASARITLNRPERKNPLTFDSYAELRDLFGALKPCRATCKAVVLTGAGDNFCSGGDVHEIIGPLVRLKAPELLMFTRMTGDLVKAMRLCPQPIVAAIDGVCAGAGAILAMASDLRVGTARSKTAFLFNRVGLAGCDMGACAMLPRIVGQGRASELLYTGRALGGEEAERWGFFNRLVAPERVARRGAWRSRASSPPARPSRNGITKTMLHQEWAMTIEQAIEAEAQAQAICMLTRGLHARLRGLRREAEAALRGELKMLKLHGFAQSGNTFKVAFLLRALGVPWQPVPMSFADFAGGKTRDAAWREGVNEMGEVPVLEDERGKQDHAVGRHPDDARRAARQARRPRRRRAARSAALALLRQPQVHELLRDLALHEVVRRERARPRRRRVPEEPHRQRLLHRR